MVRHCSASIWTPHPIPPITLPGDVMLCGLCRSEAANSFHHLIPRTVHANKWFKKRLTREEIRSGVELCRQCHNAIHDFIPDEKELGRHYNTVEKLLTHAQVAKYVEWKRTRARSSPSTRP